MKKYMQILFMLSLTLLLTSCTWLTREENSDAYDTLKEQYFDYLDHDIVLEDNLYQFINDASLITSKSSVKVQVDIYHALGYRLATRYGSGIIYEESDHSYFLLTQNSLLERTSLQTIRIQITDYTGYVYMASINSESASLNLATLIISKQEQRILELATFANNDPLTKEPVMLISYSNQIVNQMTMGFIQQILTNEDVTLFETSIHSDTYGNGGLLINTSLECVGMQLSVENDVSIVVSAQTIKIYLESIQT